MIIENEERTNEQKVARGKFALSLILLMSLVILAGSIVNRCSDKHHAVVPPDGAMDAALPALLEDYENAVVIHKEPAHKVSYFPVCEAEDSLTMLEFRMSIGDVPVKDMDKANALAEELRNTVKLYKQDPSNMVVNHNRRIRFKYEDKTYTCIQVIDTNLVESHLKHMMCLEDLGFSKEEIDKMIQDN